MTGEKSEQFPSVGINAVDSALNWAWLVDFGQGNFAVAKMTAEIGILNQWDNFTLFARGVVHQLQGEYVLALSLLEEAFAISPDRRQKLAIAAIAYLTELQSRAILPDGFSLNLENELLDSSWQQRAKNLKEQIDNPQQQIEASFIYLVTAIEPTLRTTLARLTEVTAKQAYLQEIQQQLTQQIELYQGLELFPMAEKLYSSLAELLALAGQVKLGWDILAPLANAYQQAGQYLETGWYLLCQGDLIVSIAPWGKPILFGYRLQESVNSYLADNTFAQEEADLSSFSQSSFDRSLIDSAAAQRLYLQARQSFATAKARRGEGMTILRLAYLNGIAGQWNLAAYGYEEAKECFEEMGDRLNSIAAEMGKFWSCLHYQKLEGDLLKRAQELAKLVKDNGAFSWGMSWGKAFAYAALETLLVEQDREVALNFIHLAEIIVGAFASPAQKQESLLIGQPIRKALEFDFLMELIYTRLAFLFAQEDDWLQAFTMAEMARIHTWKEPQQQESCYQSWQIPLLSLETIANYLADDSLLLAYLITKEGLLAWAINSTGIAETYLLKAESTLPGQNISKSSFLFDYLNQKDQLDFIKLKTEHLDKLAQNLLTPLATAIEQAKHLVVVPCFPLPGVTFANLPWQEQPLRLQKSISYLPTASQLLSFSSQHSDSEEALIVVNLPQINQKSAQKKQLSNFYSFSLIQGLAKIIGELYGVQPLVNEQATQESFFAAIAQKPQIVHFFAHYRFPSSSSSTPEIVFVGKEAISVKQLSQLELKATLVIISLWHTPPKRELVDQLTRLAQNLLDRGTKAVVLDFGASNKIATTMLLVFLHLGLSAGQSLGFSFWDAQQQLSRTTVKEVLYFCQLLQDSIPWQLDSDRAARALITKYMGDCLALGGNYARALEAYDIASKILYSTGYTDQAKTIQSLYLDLRFLAGISTDFKRDILIFNSPQYWGTCTIIGDWR
jgi:hypothetical protein